MSTQIAFALLCLGMALTPGPNMAYVVSRSICQGRRAGLISLGGVAFGYAFYVFLTSFGITALIIACPIAHGVIRLAGALYLLWLAWGAVRPGGRSHFEVKALAKDSYRKLFLMGLATNILNPKVAAMYLSLLPHFVDPDRGSLLAQALILGAVQIVVSICVHTLIILSAGWISAFLTRSAGFALFQRWIMGAVLATLAVRMATEA
jgi:threonine/homoserine/homoserine lactone efflux protein